jgi:cell division protein FtsL
VVAIGGPALGELKWVVIALAVLTVLSVISVVLETHHGRQMDRRITRMFSVHSPKLGQLSLF